MPTFSNTSAKRLSECDERLQLLLHTVIKYYDCKILTGHRNKEGQDEMFELGRSKVSWPNSKHNSKPSKAVDVTPYPVPKRWGASWKDRVKFYELKAVLFYEAARLGIKLRFGGDWDMDTDYHDNIFDDLVHFQIED